MNACVAPHHLDRARAVLFGARPPSLDELRSSSWKDTLRKAFRKRAFETHPDRANALGRSEATLTVEFRELEHAYELVTAHLSAPVPVPAPQPRQPAPAPRGRPSRYAPPPASPPRARASRYAPPPASPPRARPARPAADAELFFKGPMPRRELRFAEFLYYSGVVSWQQLVAAITWQLQHRPRVGELAVACGLMTKQEVAQLLGQRLRTRSQTAFAQFAVDEGRISAAQRTRLLSQQRSMQPLKHQRAQQRDGTHELERGKPLFGPLVRCAAGGGAEACHADACGDQPCSACSRVSKIVNTVLRRAISRMLFTRAVRPQSFRGVWPLRAFCSASTMVARPELSM